MSEIQSILTPVTELFSSQEDFVKFYEEILSMIRQSADQIMESLPNSIDLVKERFPVSEKEGSDTIQILAMICVFSYDVYIKKSMIEKLIHDNLKEKEKGTGTKEKK